MKILTFAKVGLCFVLFFLISINPADADNNTTDNNTSAANESFIIVNKNPLIDNQSVQIFADDKLEFWIFDNTTKKFTPGGVIKLLFQAKMLENKQLENKQLEIVSHSITEAILDYGKKLSSKILGGNETVGNNSEYFREHRFDEISENYSVEAVGEYNLIPTINKITINVTTNYINRTVGKDGKRYNLTSLNSLNSRSLKYHKDDSQKADSLIISIDDFITAGDDLQIKINGLTSSSQKVELNNLSVTRVIETQMNLADSIEEFKSMTNEKLLKDQLFFQLDLIKEDGQNITSELANHLNNKKKNLLEQELKEVRDREKNKSDELIGAKSNLRTEVFIPAGILIVLGIIIGYFNVNRWKKESEYFGLYTSKAKIASPITIVIILTIILLILIGIIIYQYTGDLDMLRFLI